MIRSLLTTLIFTLIMLLNYNIQAQTTIEVCDQADIISGNIHGHLNCSRDILITSTSTQGSEGTIISGDIYTSGTVLITPGYSKVTITPSLDEDQDQNILPHNRDRKTHIGNGSSGTGGRLVNTHAHHLDNSLFFYPNPAKKSINFSSYKEFIKNYEIINTQGTVLLKGIFNNKTLDYKVNIETLKTGFYVVNMMLITGETTTKALIKH